MIKNLTRDSIKIAYILGSARSGSTLIERLLACSSHIQGLGEVIHINELFRENRMCSCGKKISECLYWNKILKDTDTLDFLKVQYPKNTLWDKFKLMIDLYLWKDLNFSENYRDNNIKLFSTFLKLRGKDILIDSSKIPLRFYYLNKIRQLKLYPVHVVRNPLGVVWSYTRNIEHKSLDWKVPSIKKACLDWKRVNKFTEMVLKGCSRRLLVRYEDMCRNPQMELDRIFTYLGIPNVKIDDILPLAPSHMIAGNRMAKKVITEIYDLKSWESGFSEYEKDRIIKYTKKYFQKYKYHNEIN